MENSSSIFKGYCEISHGVQTIQSTISSGVSCQSRLDLHQELEALQSNLLNLQQSVAKPEEPLYKSLSALSNQIITLYRQVEEGFEKYQISVIANTALKLGNSLQAGKVLQAAYLANQVKSAINCLFAQRLPSLQNRKVVQVAQKLASQVLEQPTSMTQAYSLRLISLLKTLMQETSSQLEPLLFPEEAELIIELYEIADLFEGGYAQKARGKIRQQLHRYPASIRRCLSEEMQGMQAANLVRTAAQELTGETEILSPAL